MKRRSFFILLLFACQALPSRSADGFIFFHNNNLVHPETGATYRAGIFRNNWDGIDGNGTVGAGQGFTAGLFLASNLTTPLATTTFRSATAQEVFATTQGVRVPGVAPGQKAHLVVRVWPTSAGSYEAARTACCYGPVGEQGFVSKPLGDGAAIPTPDLAPFRGFELSDGALTPTGIQNTQFERPITAWASIFIGPPEEWSIYRPEATNGINNIVGVLNSFETTHFETGAADGNVAFILLSSPAVGEAGISGFSYLQQVTSRTRYTFTYSVGNPASGSNNLGAFNLAGFPGYRVELRTDNGIVLASDNNSMGTQIPEGQFRTNKIVFTIGTNDPAIGQSFSVRLVNLNQTSVSGSPAAAVAFDNVTVLVERPPQFTISRSASRTEIVWGGAPTFILESANTLASASWSPMALPPPDEFGMRRFTLNPTGLANFFRLRAP